MTLEIVNYGPGLVTRGLLWQPDLSEQGGVAELLDQARESIYDDYAKASDVPIDRLFVDPETFDAIDRAKVRERSLGLPMTILGLVVTSAADGEARCMYSVT
jgi:hypothetical protein